jgi:predicted ATPase
MAATSRASTNGQRARGAPRIARVKLSNWRNFKTVDAELQLRNFLVGPNASGKSNFLDAFRFLGDIVAISGGLESAVEERGGVSRVRCLAARKQSDVAIEVTLSDASEDLWQYRLAFSQDSKRRPIVTKETVYHGQTLLLNRPDDPADKEDPERLRQTYLEQVNANRDFRAIADFLRSIRYYHIVPQLVRENDRWESPQGDPYGGDFLERILRTNKRTQHARLSRIRGALAIAVPQLTALEAVRDEKGVPHLRGRYEHWRPQGAWQNESEFSDGTLRLIGLLWSLLDGEGPLLLEEPELSLHAEVVRRIPQLMARVQGKSGRQVIVSTHSDDLLRGEGIAPDEVFVFEPSMDGTSVRSGVTIEDVHQLLEAGMPLADALLPHTRPANVDRLALALRD